MRIKGYEKGCVNMLPAKQWNSCQDAGLLWQENKISAGTFLMKLPVGMEGHQIWCPCLATNNQAEQNTGIHEGLKTYKINLKFLIHKPKLLFGKNGAKSNHILESRSYVILVFPRAGTYHSWPGSKAALHAAPTETFVTMQWLHVASHVMLSLVSTHLDSAPRSFQYNMEL